MKREIIISIRFGQKAMVGIICLAFLCFHPKILGSEQLTLTTYYPSPYGGYARLLTTNLTVLARDGSGVAVGGYTSPGSAKLAVNGNVGIRTTSPTQRLDVVGNVRSRQQIYWGSKYPHKGILSSDQGSSIELGGQGTPYIDFANDRWCDYDARIILTGNDSLRFDGTRVGIGRNPSYPLDVQGDARVNGDLRVTGRIRGMCRYVWYGINTNERCGWNERVFATYGAGSCVRGMLFLGGRLQSRWNWVYTSTQCDRSGWLLCCRIQ